MKKTRFSEQQIAFILKQAEEGVAVAEVCRKAGISDATFYNWRKKYGGLMPSEVRRLKQLESLPSGAVLDLASPVPQMHWYQTLHGKPTGFGYISRTPTSVDAASQRMAGLILAGAAVIFFTESTPRWQLRNPREDTPGRLMVADEPQNEPIVFSADDSSAANRQRMRLSRMGC